MADRPIIFSAPTIRALLDGVIHDGYPVAA